MSLGRKWGVLIMFMGEYRHTVDAKRMIVPAKFREGLGEQFVLTRGLDQCLFGYPMNEWKLIEELKALPLTKRRPRIYPILFPVRPNANWTSREGLILVSSLLNYAKTGKRMCCHRGFQSN